MVVVWSQTGAVHDGGRWESERLPGNPHTPMRSASRIPRRFRLPSQPSGKGGGRGRKAAGGEGGKGCRSLPAVVGFGCNLLSRIDPDGFFFFFLFCFSSFAVERETTPRGQRTRKYLLGTLTFFDPLRRRRPSTRANSYPTTVGLYEISTFAPREVFNVFKPGSLVGFKLVYRMCG